jgi:hypothetical protein
MFVRSPRWWVFGILANAVVSASAGSQVCTVNPGGSDSIDDAPAIIDALDRCGKGGTVEFLNETYHINTVVNISGLEDCEIDLKGTLLVSVMSCSSTVTHCYSGAPTSRTGSITRFPSATRTLQRPGSSAAKPFVSMEMAMAP